MSQRKDAMRTIEKDAGVEGLVLRPLSAKLLEPTIPEREGLVDRAKLLDISGRGRKPQIQLASDLNIKDYPCPAGGCLLTDPAFSKRVKDLIDHNELTQEDVSFLNHGRHFRIEETAKLIVGHDEHDNKILEDKASGVLFTPEEEVSGATALGRGDFSKQDTILLACRLVARYFDKKSNSQTARVVVKYKGKSDIMEVEPFTDTQAKRYLI